MMRRAGGGVGSSAMSGRSMDKLLLPEKKGSPLTCSHSYVSLCP